MKLRIATYVLALAAASSALGANTFTCPITKSKPVNFQPTGAFEGKASDLVGSDKLFTVFPGNWNFIQRVDGKYRVPKVFWGSSTIDLSQEVRKSSLTITGRRLDGEPGLLEFGGANTAWVDKGYFITSEFFVPTPGCWEVTGHFHGADLKIVIAVK